MMPSLDRLKPFDGGGDDDDDGLDKDLDRDLWLVVEKGCVCDSADCVYRDSVRTVPIFQFSNEHPKCPWYVAGNLLAFRLYSIV